MSDKPTNTLELVKYLDDHPDLIVSYPEPLMIAGLPVRFSGLEGAATFDRYADGRLVFLNGGSIQVDRTRPDDPDCFNLTLIEFDESGFSYKLPRFHMRFDYYVKPERKPKPTYACPRCGRTLAELKRDRDSDGDVCLVCLVAMKREGGRF